MDTHRVLLRHLKKEEKVLNVSNDFSKLQTNVERVNFAYDLLKTYDFLPEITVDGKNNALSVDFRQKGNEMFKQRQSKKSVDFYTRSIANAEYSSANLALAYSNRSAVLFEGQLYAECLKDISRALTIQQCPDNIKSKLETRQEKALTLLGEQEKIEADYLRPFIPEDDKNSLIDCASNALKIKYTKELGRHIVATRQIDPGEIVALENPFCHVLIDELSSTCHHCLRLCYNLIPCEKCTYTLYCGEECQKLAYASYHKYECPIVATLRIMEVDKLLLLPLRVALIVKDEYKLLKEYKINDSECYKSNRYKEIHNLVANTEKRSVADLFERVTSAAVIYHLVQDYSCFFNNHTDDQYIKDILKELLLLHMQTGPCNFHEITQNKATRNTIESKEIGAGAFSFLSMFNHSCSPNVTRICYGTMIAVVALETIREGQQCFDNYGYHHAVMSKLDRQKHLKTQYFFDCQCEACSNDFPLYQDMITTDPDEIITLEEINKLEQGDLDTAKHIFKELVKKTKEVSKLPKPNKTLNELQEVLKQCYFIFSGVKSPF